MSWLGHLWTEWKQLKNERLYRRVPIDVPVKIYLENQEDTRQERLDNWSPAGVFIRTPDVLPLETNLRVEFALSEKEGSFLRLRGQVVRHQTNKESGEIEGMGIMFVDFTETGIVILREVLSRISTTTPVIPLESQ